MKETPNILEQSIGTKAKQTQASKNLIKNIIENDNAEDYYSSSRSDNYFDEQESVQDEEDSGKDSEFDDV